MTGKLYINGQDAWTTWGVFLEEGSYAKLLSGDSMKPYSTNQSRSVDGILITMKNPRMEERRLTIVFCFADTGAFFVRFNSFMDAIKGGISLLNLRVPEVGKTFRLAYEGSTNMIQSGSVIGKIAVRFLEPDPTNRTL